MIPKIELILVRAYLLNCRSPSLNGSKNLLVKPKFNLKSLLFDIKNIVLQLTDLNPC